MQVILEQDLEDSNDKEIESVASRLNKWLSDYNDPLSQKQFQKLMKKIAPFFNEQQVKELFNTIDFENIGVIHKEILETDNYLAKLIMKLYQQEPLLMDLTANEDDDDSFFDDEKVSIMTPTMSLLPVPSADFELQEELEELQRENNELRKWIKTVGKPSALRVAQLEATIKIFESENANFNTQLEKLSTERESVKELESHLSTLQLSTNFVNKENSVLKETMEKCNKTIKLKDCQLKEANKRIESLQGLNDELRSINDEYHSINNELNTAKEEDQEDLQNLRSLLVEYQLQIQHIQNEKNEIAQHIERENNDLLNELNQKEIELANDHHSNRSTSTIKINFHARTRTMSIPKEYIPNSNRRQRFLSRLSSLPTGPGTPEVMQSVQFITVNDNNYIQSTTPMTDTNTGMTPNALNMPSANPMFGSPNQSRITITCTNSNNTHGNLSPVLSESRRSIPSIIDIKSDESSHAFPVHPPEYHQYMPSSTSLFLKYSDDYLSLPRGQQSNSTLNGGNNSFYNDNSYLCVNNGNSARTPVHRTQSTPILTSIASGVDNDDILNESNHDNEAKAFFDESMRKEIELETRQKVEKEFKKRFEIAAQQIRVDSHIELKKNEDEYQNNLKKLTSEILKLNNRIMHLKEEKKKLNESSYVKMENMRLKINDLEMEIESKNENENVFDDINNSDTFFNKRRSTKKKRKSSKKKNKKRRSSNKNPYYYDQMCTTSCALPTWLGGKGKQ